MKYHPIRKTDDMSEDFSHNRDYIGKHWNRKYIRAIQAVLNSTKGKIGKGTSFFMKAFGENVDEYHKLLEMPETMIIYRYFFEWLGQDVGREAAIRILGNDAICNASTDAWWRTFNECKQKLSTDKWNLLIEFIHNSNFDAQCDVDDAIAEKLLRFYTNYRKAIIEEGTDLFKLKEEYDKNPLHSLRRVKHNNN